MTLAWALVALVLLGVFTPTWVVAWQLWSSRMSQQRRSLARRSVAAPFVPGPRRPS